MRSEIALARSRAAPLSGSFCQPYLYPLLCIRIPAPKSASTQCGVLTLLPDSWPKPFLLLAKHLCTASSHLLHQSLVLVPPLSACPLSQHQSVPFVPPPGLRIRQSLTLGSVAWYPAALAGRAGGGWRRKWRRRAPGVGRSRGCSRSRAAASRGAGAAAAPYCGPKRPRPSHG